MDSLYGGKPGISFILKASYPSEKDMINAFKKGDNYTAVWYGEYVLIDTINKNNKDNGKIYRRGLDYQNDRGGAEYLGQIVGPSSGTPYMELTTLDHAKEHAAIEADNDIIYKRYPTGWDKENNCYIVEKGGDGSDLASFKFNTDNHSLVPGKYVDENSEDQWNDDILYTWVNVKDDTENDNSWFYVGFQFPYTVIDYTSKIVSPYRYDEKTQKYVYEDTSDAIRIDENPNADDLDPEKIGQHPFWERWQINIPKGVQGNSLQNFRVTSIDKETKIYNVSAISAEWDDDRGYFVTKVNEEDYYYNPEKNPECTDTTKHPVKPNDPNEDIKHNESIVEPDTRKILVLDYVVYDENAEGDVYTLFIGDYNMINEVYIDDDGTIRIKMTHDNDYIYEQRIKWVDLVEVSTGTGKKGGKFTFTWNTWTLDEEGNKIPNTSVFETSWIRGLEIKGDGSILYTYAGIEDKIKEHLPEGAIKYQDDDGNDIDGVYRVEKFLQWIQSVTLDPETGYLEIKDNQGTITYNATLDWIKRILIDEDGTVHYIHTAKAADENGNFVGIEDGNSQDEFISNLIWWIKDAYITESGEIHLVLNTGNELVVNKADTDSDESFILKNITDVKLNTALEDDKHIQIKYNDGDYVPIGDPINYIQDAIVRPTDWHLLVLYSDPEHRATAEDLDDEMRDTNGHLWANNIVGSDGVVTDSTIYWRDLGTIKDQHGLLIGFNVARSDIEADPDAEGSPLKYLNDHYPDGLTTEHNTENGEAIEGKIITVGDDSEDKEFYAYDYNKGEWYYLGMIANAIDARLINPDVMSEIQCEQIRQTVGFDGLLFTAGNTNYIADDSFPRYWSSEDDSTMFDINTMTTEWEPLEGE